MKGKNLKKLITLQVHVPHDPLHGVGLPRGGLPVREDGAVVAVENIY